MNEISSKDDKVIEACEKEYNIFVDESNRLENKVRARYFKDYVNDQKRESYKFQIEIFLKKWKNISMLPLRKNRVSDWCDGCLANRKGKFGTTEYECGKMNDCGDCLEYHKRPLQSSSKVSINYMNHNIFADIKNDFSDYFSIAKNMIKLLNDMFPFFNNQIVPRYLGISHCGGKIILRFKGTNYHYHTYTNKSFNFDRDYVKVHMGKYNE